MKLLYLLSLAFAGLFVVGCSDSIIKPTNRFMSEVEADMRINSRSSSGMQGYPVSIECDEWLNMTSHAQKGHKHYFRCICKN